MQGKQSMLPPTQPPTKHPGASNAWLPITPTPAKETTQIGEPTYWLISYTKSSPRNAMQLTGSLDEPKYSPSSTASSTNAAHLKQAFS